MRIKRQGECDCKICKGHSDPPKDGKMVFGGWRCECSCHITDEQREAIRKRREALLKDVRRIK